MAPAVIVLLSDFGTQDAYAGVLRAVLMSRSPEARLIDLTHGVPPGDVATGAFLLWQSRPHLPQGSIVLAVVDPGVGTPRRPIALTLAGLTCVGPDNGLFSYLLLESPEVQAVEIKVPQAQPSRVSQTFHGRDIFAPAASLLAAGARLEDLGPRAQGLVSLPGPRLEVEGGEAHGEVLHIDGFGNVVTSIGAVHGDRGGAALQPCWRAGTAHVPLGRQASVRLASGRELPLRRTFADVAEGEAVAYVGSDGLVEIGINRGRADTSLSLGRGQPVVLSWKG